MTSVFMVFELSASYTIIVPVMVANLVAYLVARTLNRVSFFDMVAAQDGMLLPSAERQREWRPLRVEDAMAAAAPGEPEVAGFDETAPVLHPDEALDSALRLFGSRERLRVVSRRSPSTVLGTLSLADVLKAYGVRRS
jgi:CIC family chloride channel protein